MRPSGRSGLYGSDRNDRSLTRAAQKRSHNRNGIGNVFAETSGRSLSLLAAILAGGVILRLWGLTFGFPILSNLYIRPDESLVVASAVQFFERAGHPGFFAYPALMIEICALLYSLVPRTFAEDPSIYFLIPRALSVAAGSLTIVAIYAIGVRLSDNRSGLIAAALYAYSPLAARDAHFGVTDSLLVLLITMSLLQSLRTGRKVFLLGVIYGLACSTKYTALLAAPAVAWPLLRRLRFKDVAIAAAVAAGTFICLNPYAFLDPGSRTKVLEILYVLFKHQPGDAVWSLSSAIGQILRPLDFGPGSYIGLILALPAVLVVRSTGTMALIMLIGGFAGALLPFQHGVPYRYLLPLLPPISLLAGLTLSRIPSGSAAALITLLIAAPGARIAWETNDRLGRTDTRTLAGEWIARHTRVDVPVVICGGPEAEPQLRESAVSIARRVAYVHRIYGESSGDIVSIPYELMKSGAGTREIYRNPEREEIRSAEAIVVKTQYPNGMGNCDPTVGSRFTGQVLRREAFSPLLPAQTPWVLDTVDAFFLPLRPLDSVVRPGPQITIEHLRF